MAPPPPTGLTSTVTASTVTLQWLGAVNSTSYIVEAGSAPGLTDRARFDTLSSATTLIVLDVPVGIYYVRLRASSDGALSAPSNEAMVVVAGGAACMPNAPEALTAAASGSTVLLSWSAPGGCAPAWYVIEAGSSSGLSDLANFSTGTPSTVFSTASVASGTYYVRVRAATSAGASAPSNEVSFTVGCPVAAPDGLVGNSKGSTVTLSWQAGGGCAPTAYVIQAGSSPGLNDLANFATGNAATRFAAIGVADGTYYVRVRATVGAALSAPSNEVTIVVRTSIPCSYSFSPSSAAWPSGGGTAATTLSASCSWSLSTDVSWITIMSPLSGATAGVVSYIVNANTSSATRTGRIIAQGAGGTASFTVTQSYLAPPPETLCNLTFSPPSQIVGSAGGTYVLALQAYGPLGDPACCRWTLTTNAPGVGLSAAGGVGSATISVVVAANRGGDRTGTIFAAAPSAQVAHTVMQGAAAALSYGALVP